MRHLRTIADRVAARDAKVLITGESGVGKDVLARYVHAMSTRGAGPFIAVNCGAITETLLESELFGHAKGSFTGAYRDKPGKLQIAHRGTIFLDEIGEMSLRMQATILRFLENGEIQQVGSETVSARVDVRVIAATNRDLPEMVAAGLFREDLMYRLDVVHPHVPPLRERREDIRPLIDHFLATPLRTVELTAETLDALEAYDWPGNIRELQNVLERAIGMSASDTIHVEDLPAAVRKGSSGRAVPVRERRRQVSDDLFDGLLGGRYAFWQDVHRLFIQRDLTRHDIRHLVRRGLAITCGTYRPMVALFGMLESDYKRFMNFLASHDCEVDFREFRRPTSRPDM